MARASSAGRTRQGEKLRGELLHFKVKGQDGWGVGAIRTRHDGGEVKITGKMLGARPGDTVELTGIHEVSKWGPQFKVFSVEVVVPEDAAGVVGWLASVLPQISRRRAEQLVEAHGVEGTWRVLEGRDVAALVAIDGVTPTRAEEICDAYHEVKGERDRMVALKGFGLTDNQIARVLETWGGKAVEKLREDPYALMAMVTGFGWVKADAVALRMGLPRDSESRLRAGIMHKMQEASFDGHCYVPGGKLPRIVADAKMCGVAEELVRDVLERMIAAGKLVRRGKGVFLPKLDKDEQDLAECFAERVRAAQGRAA